jgi:hypothetical protein
VVHVNEGGGTRKKSEIKNKNKTNKSDTTVSDSKTNNLQDTKEFQQFSAEFQQFSNPKIKANKIKVNKIKVKQSKDIKDFDPSNYQYFNSKKFCEVWDKFLEMRKKRRNPMTEYAKKLLIERLIRLSDNDIIVAIEIINQSILNSWLGVFSLKDDSNIGKGSVLPCKHCKFYFSKETIKKHELECSKNPDNIISMTDLDTAPEDFKKNLNELIKTKSLKR